MISIAGGCTRLERLAIEGCSDALTDCAAEAIAHGLPKLRWLHASGCEALTQAGVETLRRALPHALADSMVGGSGGLAWL